MALLLVLRHGKAGDSELGDRERELTARGRRDALSIARTLADPALLPERIISSSAPRARETAELVARELDRAHALDALDELYLAEPEPYLAAVARLAGAAERVLVVGHNPGLEQLVELLTGTRVSLPTASLAVCSLPCALSELAPSVRGSFQGLFSPKG
jgi:phosphohistidine phosphatase